MQANKKQNAKTVLVDLARIADKDYQKRVWIEASSPNECDSFDDAVCDFFQGSEDLFEKRINFDITDYQFLLLSDFRAVFDDFVCSSVRPYLDKDFIDTPEWDKIVKKAQQVLDAFGYKSISGVAVPNTNST
jgi:hypothetical protein